MAAKVDTNKCTGCGSCVDTCPISAISIDSDKANVDADQCVDCGACVDACPVSAIELN